MLSSRIILSLTNRSGFSSLQYLVWSWYLVVQYYSWSHAHIWWLSLISFNGWKQWLNLLKANLEVEYSDSSLLSWLNLSSVNLHYREDFSGLTLSIGMFTHSRHAHESGRELNFRLASRMSWFLKTQQEVSWREISSTPIPTHKELPFATHKPIMTLVG